MAKVSALRVLSTALAAALAHEQTMAQSQQSRSNLLLDAERADADESADERSANETAGASAGAWALVRLNEVSNDVSHKDLVSQQLRVAVRTCCGSTRPSAAR